MLKPEKPLKAYNKNGLWAGYMGETSTKFAIRYKEHINI